MKRRLFTLLLFIIALPVLSGCVCFACKDQMSVQRDYLSARDECQDASELRIESYDSYQQTQANRDPFYAMMTPRQKAREEGRMMKERKSMLFGMFKDCMTSKDWLMSKPKEPAKEEGAPNIIETARKPVNSTRTQTVPAPVPASAPKRATQSLQQQQPALKPQVAAPVTQVQRTEVQNPQVVKPENTQIIPAAPVKQPVVKYPPVMVPAEPGKQSVVQNPQVLNTSPESPYTTLERVLSRPSTSQ